MFAIANMYAFHHSSWQHVITSHT